MIEPLTDLGRELGYGVEIPTGRAAGATRKQIVIATGPANRDVRTLVPELAHALGLDYEQYGRQQAEVLVDCVTYIV